MGWMAEDWSTEVGVPYEAPSAAHWFGTDVLGRSVWSKVLKGTEVAMSIGLVVALISVIIGTLLGATAGYFGGWVDELVVWMYTAVASVPSIMLLISITLVIGKGDLGLYISLALTSWVEVCRLIRGEVKKHKEQEYVQAVTALGAGHMRKLFLHILPNVVHILIVRFSLTFQYAIKAEVILSYLGIGVQNKPSWGIMIDDAKVELMRGVWWQLTFATAAMFCIVLAFNVLGDALRDALDPKLRDK